MGDSNQEEHEQISASLEIEELDVNLFRSKSLWLPTNARGGFGGQVISQALVSATNCVNPAFGLHSLHCYFLLSVSVSTPIIYHVDRVRQGRTYVTLSVRANQNGRIVFVLMCSFQKPEPWQPSYQWPMPQVPAPEDCEDEVAHILKKIESPETPSWEKKLYKNALADRMKSPIAVKLAKKHVTSDNLIVYMYWMQARNIPKYEAPFQKCILSYISDLNFISTVPKIIGLKKYGKGPDAVGMVSTLDHSIYFYNDDFDCGDWLLHVVSSPRTGFGRGVVHGRMYSRNGNLVAVTSQEGVVRANIRKPADSNVDAKL